MGLSDGALYGVCCAIYVGLVAIWIGFTFLYPKLADRFMTPPKSNAYKVNGEGG